MNNFKIGDRVKTHYIDFFKNTYIGTITDIEEAFDEFPARYGVSIVNTPFFYDPAYFTADQLTHTEER